jgi:predicted DsbA family dithiol-disulfide isomerase
MMTINIWSDVRCPFCYIGKRKMEKGLEKFTHKDEVKISWHSFELDPSLQTNTEINSLQYFSEIKGIPVNQAKQMQQQVAHIAKEVGIEINNDKSIVANSFNAHRLIQFAKTKGLANEIEEELFKAHFTDGKNIDDIEVLVQTGVSVGLDEKEVTEMLASDAFSKEVKQDEMQAQSLGIRGVPFFIFNNKYAVSGAQSPDTFLEVLEQTWEEFEKENKPVVISEGDNCNIDGTCN